MAEDTRLVRLSLNGIPLSPPAWELTIAPGRTNVLKVEPNRQQAGDRELDAVVDKILPHGRCERLQSRLRSSGSCEVALGPMTAPPVYQFEAGVVYRRGYRVHVTVKDMSAGDPVYSITLYQGLSSKPVAWQQGAPILAGEERLLAGNEDRVVYNPLYGVEAALALRLSEGALRDGDALEVKCRLNEGAPTDQLTCELRVSAPDGKPLLTRPIKLTSPGAWVSEKIDAAQWPPGNYRIGLFPVVDGRTWEEGPEITYHRRKADPNAVRISPVAPWALRRDAKREEIVITDFEDAIRKWGDKDVRGWSFARGRNGAALQCPAGTPADPIALRPQLSGFYAVYVRLHASGCLLQVGEAGLVRALTRSTGARDDFLCAADLSNSPIRIYALDPLVKLASGLAKLRLVPVTRESVEAFHRETSNPPTPLYGVNDWHCYFEGGAIRQERDQFDAIIGAQEDLGLRTIDWSIGRSWVEYHSKLPGTTRFPCVPLKEALKVYPKAMIYEGSDIMTNKFDALDEALDSRRRFPVQVWPWLAMNRHYGDAYGGIFASKFFRTHPEWHRWRKNAKAADKGEVCYFFPEVRQERIDIFLEVARKGVDGLLVGCCRQVPMLLYHPDMVAAYKKEKSIDPLKIDASDGDAYRDWITWRADHFTKVLRGLRKGLGPIAQERGRRIPVAVRVPSAGLFYNLAQGLDVEQWLREGLIDQLQLDPLEDRGGRGSHDVRPYLALCRQYGVPLIAGVGATW